MNKGIVQLLITLFVLFSNTTVFAADKLTFIVQPILEPEQSKKFYQPLADYLSKASGTEVELVTALNFLTYWQTMIKGDYDLILDAAHFTSYRIEKLDYTPLAKVPGSVSYTLVTHPDLVVFEPKELIGNTIATASPPSMGMTRLREMFNNPVRQPRFKEAGSVEAALTMINNDQADAAIVPTPLLNNHPELNVLLTTDAAPHVTVSASPSVPADIQEKIRQALLNAKDLEQGRAMLNRINFSEFVPAPLDLYAGYDELLRDQWGY